MRVDVDVDVDDDDASAPSSVAASASGHDVTYHCLRGAPILKQWCDHHLLCWIIASSSTVYYSYLLLILLNCSVEMLRLSGSGLINNVTSN